MDVDWREMLAIMADAVRIAVKVGAQVVLVAGLIAAAMAFAALVFALSGRWPWFVRRLF